MTLPLLIGLAVVAAAVYGVHVARSEWRGGDGADVAPPEWWPFDQPAWRGLIRSGPVAAVEGLLVGARSLASLLPAPAALDAGFEAAILLALALMALVFLYNRPAWAVAPRFRALPGAIAEWNGVSAGSQDPAPQCDPCTTTTAASRMTSRSSRGGGRSQPSPAGSAC